MLDNKTKRRIDTARDILVGKVPDPKSQVEQITIALIYKFMDDMDARSEELGGKREFFTGKYNKYSWKKLMSPSLGGFDVLNLYSEAIQEMNLNPNIPQLFRDIFKNAYLPYRDPETLKSFLKTIDEFEYDHSERLGDSFEYLLSVLGSQGDAGQFRTPRHIIDFMVEIIAPKKDEKILDPACGTAGFLISSYKHILKHNSSNYSVGDSKEAFELKDVSLDELTTGSTKHYKGDKLTPDERAKLSKNINGYDISPDMVRLSLVNMYLHGFAEPNIEEYDTLTSEDKWNEYADVILANPPFMSPKGGIKPHKRFSIQSKRSEVLFVDYMVEHLTPNGRAAIIVPEGIIFQSGTAYKQLRKMLVENYLFGIVSLPAGVFNPYSGVKTSILLIDKALNKKSDEILFVKIENDGFDLGAQRRPNNKSELPEVLKSIKEFISCTYEGNGFDTEELKNVSAVLKQKIGSNGEWNLSGAKYEDKKIIYSSYKLTAFEEAIEQIKYSNKIAKKNFKSSGKYPIIDQSELFIAGYWNNKEDVFVVDKPVTIFGDHTRCVKYVDFDFVLGADGVKVLKPKDTYDPKFFYYLVKSIEVPNLGYSRHYKELKESRIPLPSLEVQKEIVEEIEGYQKIIDGARQVVENYKPQIDIDPSWEMVELGEVCDITTGKLNANAAKENGEFPFFTCSKEVFQIDKYAFDCEALLLSGNNASGDFDVKYYNGKFNAYQRTYVLTLKSDSKSKIGYKLLKYILENNLESLKNQSIGGLTRYLRIGMITAIQVPIIPPNFQSILLERLQEEEEIIDGNKKFIALYEQKIKDRIAKVWGE